MKLYRVMRLWKSGHVSAVYTGYHLPGLWYFLHRVSVRTYDGRHWIEEERRPSWTGEQGKKFTRT